MLPCTHSFIFKISNPNEPPPTPPTGPAIIQVDDAALLLSLEVDEAHSSTADFGLVKDKDNK